MSSFFSRDELLGGLPAKRASTILFAVESRTAHLVLQTQRVGARYLTEHTAAEQEQHFLAALAHARDNESIVKIQDLERYASQWAPLVPQEANVRAAIAQLLGAKYRFRERDVPSLRRALGLDTDHVQQAFQKLYSRPLTSIYQTQLARREQIKWQQTKFGERIDSLPPFWTAFALTLTETVGAGILALPIAFAALGVWSGIILLAIFGFVNILTIIALTEAIVRNGNMRYGNNYFGRLVSDYFGGLGVAVMTVSLVILNLLTLLAYFIGVATAMEGATTISSLVWAALLFLVILYFLKRGSIEATAVSALVIGAINLALILIMAGLALPHVRAEYLMGINFPGIGGQPFEVGFLAVVFGVVLTAFYGHTSAGNAAKTVLQRESTGSQLIWGNVAALAVSAVLYALWVFAVNGSVPPAKLLGESGTALVPLAETVGPIVYVVGTVFVILAMGMASIHMALGLYFMVRERLPHHKADAVNAQGLRAQLAHPQMIFFVSVVPVILLFGLVEYLLWTNQESFTGIIGFMGALAVPILAGIFPLLLLVASRRKADYTTSGLFAWVGNPLVGAVVYFIFLASMLVDGLWLFQNPLERALAFGIAIGMLALTIILWRRGAFIPRQVVEFRLEQEPTELATFQIVAMGKLAASNVRLNYRGQENILDAAHGAVSNYRALNFIQFLLASHAARELKVWAHSVTGESDSEPLPMQATITTAQTTQVFDIQSKQGMVILPTSDTPIEICLEPKRTM